MLTRYPLDKTGKSRDNFVQNEIHTIEDQGTSIFFTRNGAYYNESLVLKQGDKTLTLNKDYEYLFFWQDATFETSHPVSLAFRIIKENLIGEIKVSYQVVGGEWIGKTESIKEIIENPPTKLSNVFWDDVINIPEAFVPTRHLHDIHDVFGLSPLVLVIEELRRSIERNSVLKLKSVYDRFLKLKQYVEANIEGRRDIANVVIPTIEQIDAKLANFVARSDVMQMIRDNGQRVIDEYIQQYGDAINKVGVQNTDIINDLTLIKDKLVQIQNNLLEHLNRIAELESQLKTLQSQQAGNVTSFDSTVADIRREIDAGLEAAKLARDENHKVLVDLLAENKVETSDLVNQRLDVAKEESNQVHQQNKAELEATFKAFELNVVNRLEQERNLRSERDVELTDLINGVQTKLEELTNSSNSDITRHADELQKLRDSFATLETRLTDNETLDKQNLENVRLNIDELADQIANLNANQIDGLTAMVETARQITISELLSQLNHTETRLTELLNSKTTELKTSIDELTKKTTKDLEDLKNEFTTRLTNVLTSYVLKETYTKEINDIKSGLTSLTAELTNDRNSNRRQFTKLDSTSEKLEDLIKRFEALPPISTNPVNTVGNQFINGVKTFMETLAIDEIIFRPYTKGGKNGIIIANKNKVDDRILFIDGQFYKNELKEENRLVTKKELVEGTVDEAILSGLITTVLNEKIAANRNGDTTSTEPKIDLNGFSIKPYIDESISGFTQDSTILINTEDKDKLKPFIPTMQLEWENTTGNTKTFTWTVPDAYDGKIGQLYITSPMREDTNNDIMHTPSVKTRYIRLVKGTVITITFMGTIVSFGSYLTNDGISSRNTIVPSFAISKPSTNQAGSFGKVTLIL